MLGELAGGVGARPPPMNRTKPYAAEATGRSTGETSHHGLGGQRVVDADERAATIVATMTAVGESVQIADTTVSSIAEQNRLT